MLIKKRSYFSMDMRILNRNSRNSWTFFQLFRCRKPLIDGCNLLFDWYLACASIWSVPQLIMLRLNSLFWNWTSLVIQYISALKLTINKFEPRFEDVSSCKFPLKQSLVVLPFESKVNHFFTFFHMNLFWKTLLSYYL